MELATKLYSKTSVLRSIQRVRMSLGVVHLSDICSANGIQLDNRFLSQKLSNVVRNTDKWPVRHHVNNNDYKHWRKSLREILIIIIIPYKHRWVDGSIKTSPHGEQNGTFTYLMTVNFFSINLQKVVGTDT